MDLLIDTIFVPQGAEYQAVVRGLKQAKCKSIQVIPIPIGCNNCEGYVASASLGNNRPQQAIIMGLCGSLSLRNNIGDAVLYQACSSLEYNLQFSDKSLSDAIYQKLQERVAWVTGLTSDRPIYQAQEKLVLAQNYPTGVVDMEGYCYLEALRQKNIAATCLRVVSDDFIHDLPNLEQAIDEGGNLKSWCLLWVMLQQPLAAKRLIQGSLIGLKVLQQITTQLFSTSEDS